MLLDYLDELNLDDEPVTRSAVAAGEGETAATEPAAERFWYVIHSYSGYENKVKKNLEHRAASMHDVGGDRIYQVIVPTEEEAELKEGQRRPIESRGFPGSILVEMTMDEDAW